MLLVVVSTAREGEGRRRTEGRRVARERAERPAAQELEVVCVLDERVCERVVDGHGGVRRAQERLELRLRRASAREQQRAGRGRTLSARACALYSRCRRT